MAEAAARPRAGRAGDRQARPRSDARPGASGRGPAPTPHAPDARAAGRANGASAAALEVDKLWQAKPDAGYSANSMRIMRTVLRKALGQAEREGIVLRNVAALSAAPHVVAKEGRTLTIDQAKALLGTVAGHRFEVAIMLALAYGLRRGEVLGLHWAAVDWDAGTVRLTHSVKRTKDRDKTSGRKTRLVVGELKTPKSRRTLVLTPGARSRPTAWRPPGSDGRSARPPNPSPAQPLPAATRPRRPARRRTAQPVHPDARTALHCPHARQHYDPVKTIAPHVAAAASGSKCKLVHLGVSEASQHALELRGGQPISLTHPR